MRRSFCFYNERFLLLRSLEDELRQDDAGADSCPSPAAGTGGRAPRAVPCANALPDPAAPFRRRRSSDRGVPA